MANLIMNKDIIKLIRDNVDIVFDENIDPSTGIRTFTVELVYGDKVIKSENLTIHD